MRALKPRAVPAFIAFVHPTLFPQSLRKQKFCATFPHRHISTTTILYSNHRKLIGPKTPPLSQPPGSTRFYGTTTIREGSKLYFVHPTPLSFRFSLWRLHYSMNRRLPFLFQIAPPPHQLDPVQTFNFVDKSPPFPPISSFSDEAKRPQEFEAFFKERDSTFWFFPRFSATLHKTDLNLSPPPPIFSYSLIPKIQPTVPQVLHVPFAFNPDKHFL